MCCKIEDVIKEYNLCQDKLVIYSKYRYGADFFAYWTHVNRGSYKVIIACLSFTTFVGQFKIILKDGLLVSPGFFHSCCFSGCQWTKDQQLTVNIEEPHKLSNMFCITIDYNSKRNKIAQKQQVCAVHNI